MLTDIFANRYADVVLWEEFGQKETRFLVQAFRILNEQLIRYYSQEGKIIEKNKRTWQIVHDKVSTELGFTELSPHWYQTQIFFQGQARPSANKFEIGKVCENFLLQQPHQGNTPDQHMKNRISFIELAYRTASEEIDRENDQDRRIFASNIPQNSLLRMRATGDPKEAMELVFEKRKNLFLNCVSELNTRFQQAGIKLSYHNGFVQISDDQFVEKNVKTPFWQIAGVPGFENIDTDMKEAIDRRDTGGRDPSFYAAKALESAIKIVSSKHGWTTGKEKGPHNYIDNLASKKNGEFIEKWESESLKQFFTNVRNPFGHGPGDGKMPELSPQQIDWSIEFCMTWIKSLITRIR